MQNSRHTLSYGRRREPQRHREKELQRNKEKERYWFVSKWIDAAFWRGLFQQSLCCFCAFDSACVCVHGMAWDGFLIFWFLFLSLCASVWFFPPLFLWSKHHSWLSWESSVEAKSSRLQQQQQQQAVPPPLPLFLFDQKPFPDRPACTSSSLVLWSPHNNTTHNQIPH